MGQLLQSLANLLGTRQGSLFLALAVLVTIAAPFADRYVIRRKRIRYRVLYNSKIGLSPVELHDGDEESAPDPQLLRVARLLDRMSVVIIRIRNTGSFDIAAEDYESEISFSFGRRIVWDARVSEATTPDLRGSVRSKLAFFTHDTAPPEPGDDRKNLGALRDWLPPRLANWFGTTQASPPQSQAELGPRWHGVRLAGLSLKRQEKFKLVVVLREPEDVHDGVITKAVERQGRIAGGRITDEKRQRRVGWPTTVVSLGVLLSGALIATLLTGTFRPADPSIACTAGSLRVEGSSAFEPTMDDIATGYSRACGGATLTTKATGSIAGLRKLRELEPGRRGEFATLSDGPADNPEPDLVPHPVAVVVGTVVVNDSVGVRRLSTEQLRGIHDGTYTDWNQLRPGPSLPIRIVSRGQNSGTRQLFEQKVLHAPEGPLSSDGCVTRDRDNPRARTIRCERATTTQVLDEVGSTPGAIGYADAPSARETASSHALTLIELDGLPPVVGNIGNGYPFWTIEYLYTKGTPEEGSLLENFLDYLRSDTARAEIREAGYLPCVDRNGVTRPRCSPT